MNRMIKLSLSLTIAALLIGCDTMGRDHKHGEHAMHADHGDKDAPVARAEIRPSQAAATQPAGQNVTGTVKFKQTGSQEVRVMVDLKGLPPNSRHGFHIHEKGDLSAPDFASAGPHYNPAGKTHGGLHADERHAGDLGNLDSDSKGNVKTEITAHGVSIDGENSIVGRSVIIHAKADDLKTDPAGDSGARIAGGVIDRREKKQ